MEAKREEGGNRLGESHKVGVEVGDIETRTRVTESGKEIEVEKEGKGHT